MKKIEALHAKLYQAVEDEMNKRQEQLDREEEKDNPNDDKVSRLEYIVGALEQAQGDLDNFLCNLDDAKNS